MLPEQVGVKCLCGETSWDSGGAHIGPRFCSQTFHCLNCQRSIWILNGYGGGPIAFQYEDESSKTLEDYVNDRLIAQWRALSEIYSGASFTTPTPPELPIGVVAHISTRLGEVIEWGPVITARETKGIAAPEDPIAVRHRVYWTALLAELGISQYRQIPNGYNGDKLEPWYTFNLCGAEVTVGPRHRVSVIEVNEPDFDSSALAGLACRDAVTFYTRDGITGIHAWTREKFVEYYQKIKETLRVEEALEEIQAGFCK
jgi:hypothetical protein